MPKDHPRYAAMEFPDYEYREYPLMVYPGAADQAKPYGKNGKPLAGIVVNNEAEYREALGLDADKGATAPETVEDKGVTRLKTPEDERADLLAEAETAGVQVDKRWSAARIQDAIDTHRAAKDVV